MKISRSIIFLVLRVAVGWHFLYEGLTKLANPEWTAEAYLRGSDGFLSPFFHSLASGKSILTLVDILNEWGLVLIGVALIVGILTRLASLSGIILLMLYYFAYPPFGEQSSAIALTGYYWIIDRNIIEALVLLLIYIFPTAEYSARNIGHLLKGSKAEQRKKGVLPEGDISRRRMLLKGLVTMPFLGGVVYAALARDNAVDPDAITGATVALKRYNLKDLKGSLPKGRLMDIEMSRLVLGCNLMGGGAHSRDLDYVNDLSKYYNTKKKIFETLAICEQAGIDATNMVSRHFPLFNEYKKITGSNMKTVCQLHLSATSKDRYRELRELRDFGATTMYIQGANSDTLVKNGRLDIIEKAIDLIRQQDMPAGVGAHSVEVLIACEEAGIKPDYYYKTMHHDRYWSAHPLEYREEFSVDGKRSDDHNRFHDNIFDLFPERTVEVISNIKVPVFGFKVLAAGSITPEDGFRYAFESGADFICVGMFDWQVVQDVNIAIDVLNSDLSRKREWYA